MDTELTKAVRAADRKAQYDEKVKRLLGNKAILAHILAGAVKEFHGMDPKDIVPCIEAEPLIGSVPVDPGLTNAPREGARVGGLNAENGEINEGLVRFDIIFYVRTRDGLAEIIVNVEAQKGQPAQYDLPNRALFYACRMLSSQKERDFTHSDYNGIRQVYSIWICMNMKENSMNHIHLTDDAVLGSCHWKGRLDLLNIVLIGLSDVLPGQGGEYGLHRLLGALLSVELSPDEKIGIMEQEYGIPVVDNTREDVNAMCNLGEGVWEMAEARGEKKIIVSMYQSGFTAEQIAGITGKDVDDIKAIIKNVPQ